MEELTVNVRGESYARAMTETGGLPPIEALAYDLRRLLEADPATFALSPEALLSHRVDPDRVGFEILNDSSETIGDVLAILTDPAGIDDPESLSRRIAAGHSDAPGCSGVWPGRRVTCRYVTVHCASRSCSGFRLTTWPRSCGACPPASRPGAAGGAGRARCRRSSWR